MTSGKEPKEGDGGTGPGCRVVEQLNSLHNFHARQVLMRNARSPCDGSIHPLFRFRFRLKRRAIPARTRDTAPIPIRWIGHVEETRVIFVRIEKFRLCIYVYVEKDLMGIRPVDDFDETFDSKLAGDSINFSDFLF